MIPIVKLFLVLGCMGSVSVSVAALSGAFSKGAQKVLRSGPPPGYYRYNCYKLFYEFNKGDFAVCLDDREKSALGTSRTPIFFDLGWKGDSKEEGPWYHYDIKSLKKHSGNEIHFTLKEGSGTDSSDKKITVKPTSSYATQWTKNLDGLEGLNDKNLSEVCQLSTGVGTSDSSIKLTCSSANYTATILQHNPRWIKRAK